MKLLILCSGSRFIGPRPRKKGLPPPPPDGLLKLEVAIPASFFSSYSYSILIQFKAFIDFILNGLNEISNVDAASITFTVFPDGNLVFGSFFFPNNQHIRNLLQFRVADLFTDFFIPVVEEAANIGISEEL